MSSKTVFVLITLIAMAAAIPAPTAGANWPAGGGVNPWIPPWVSAMPWFPQWTVCTTVGTTCLDCSTKLVCTKIGGIQRACTDPTLPYCNLGECSATPTVECAPPSTSEGQNSPVPV